MGTSIDTYKRPAVQCQPTGIRIYGYHPTRFASAADMAVAIERYFDLCEMLGKPYTMYGLALALGYNKSNFDYIETHPEFRDVVSWAKTIVIEQTESRLLQAEVPSSGLAFWMKNNANYVDKVEVEHSGDIGIAQAMREARERVKAGKRRLGEEVVDAEVTDAA